MSQQPCLNQRYQKLIADAFCVAAAMQQKSFEAAIVTAEMQRRPHAIMRPRLSIDGDKWCALYGENLQEGVAGFGDSPEAACADFDRAWTRKIQSKGKNNPGKEIWVRLEGCGADALRDLAEQILDRKNFNLKSRIFTKIDISTP